MEKYHYPNPNPKHGFTRPQRASLDNIGNLQPCDNIEERIGQVIASRGRLPKLVRSHSRSSWSSNITHIASDTLLLKVLGELFRVKRKALGGPDGLNLPDTAHLRDVLGKGLDFLLGVAGFCKVVGSSVTESEQAIWEDFAHTGMEVVHIFLI